MRFFVPWRRLVASRVFDVRKAAVVASTWTMQATKMANVRTSSFLGTSVKRTPVTWTAPARAGRVLEVRAAGKEAGVGVYGTKAGMTQVFTRKGNAMPVTVISLGEGNYVTQVKTMDTDGYNAVQVGYGPAKEKHLTKPELGHLEKAGVQPLRNLAEFKLDNVDDYQVGQKLNLSEIFKSGDLVDISGTSIGKGFQGGIKRHNFKRGLMTHGSKSHREHGSTGASATPARVYPGTKLPGQMGNETVKVRKLKVVQVDDEKGCLVVKGSVPGKPGNLLRIAPAKIVGKNV